MLFICTSLKNSMVRYEKILKVFAHIPTPIYFQNKGGGGFSCEES